MNRDPGSARDPHRPRRASEGGRRVSRVPAIPRRHARAQRLRTAAAVAVFVLIGTAWELGVRGAMIDARFFPPPTTVLRLAGEMIGSGELVAATARTLARLAVGVVTGAVPGVAVGILLAMAPTAATVLRPLVSALHPVPKTALLPLALLLVGVGETAQYLLVASGVFFVAVESAYVGVLAAPREHFDVARVLGRSRWHRGVFVALPGALPNVLGGLQIGVAVGLAVLVVGEMLVAGSGLGHLIWESWQTFRLARMFVAIGTVGVLGICLQLLVDRLRSRLAPWAHGGAR
jgi:NitT/TauT family transport system permease protein